MFRAGNVPRVGVVTIAKRWVSAAVDERRRVLNILRSPEAAGRRALALYLACRTDLPVKEARAALAAAPVSDKATNR